MHPPALPARWNVSEPVLVTETFSSRIWKVRQADGTPAIVKALKDFDDVEDELRGIHLLSWRRGEGLVRLFDGEDKMMLIEYAGERHLRAVLDDASDTAATEIAAEVMARLHSPSRHPVPGDLQPLRDRFVSLFDKAKADRNTGLQSPYVEAAEIAERLLSDPLDVRPLHGDIHHDNIIQSPRGWLAIDPKGILGDPGFDAANMFFNPLDRLCTDFERIATMATIFSRSMGQDPRRLLDHAIAYGCLSSSWHNQDKNDVEEARELSIVDAVRSVRDSSF